MTAPPLHWGTAGDERRTATVGTAMLHSDQEGWPAPRGAYGWPQATGPEGDAIQALARDIEDMQRRQGDSIAQIIGRLRELEAGANVRREGAPEGGHAPAAGDEPWDAANAEALMRSYEAHGAQAPAAPYKAGYTPSQSASQASGHAASHGAGFAYGAGAQDWIGHRFSDVTDRIRRTLTDLKPGSTMALLEERLDQFQRHIASALEDVVRRSDIEGIRLIEAHVADLGDKLVDLERQVSRLDGIEADVRSVIEQVSDERIAKLLDGNARFSADLEAVARRAAEEVHARFGSSHEPDVRAHDELRAIIEASIQDRRAAEAEAASLVNGLSGRMTALADRYDELKALTVQATQEQRQGEQTAIGMLDTLQHALVQVLDRIDVLERRPPASAPMVQEPANAAYGFGGGETFRPSPRSAVMAARERDDMDRVDAPIAPAPYTPSRDMSAEVAEMSADGEPHFDRMRRDFVADARRAKMKAAANRAEAVSSSPEPARSRGADKTRAAIARMSLPNVGGKWFGASPKLLAGALALIVAINGGLLLLNRKNTTPAAPPVVVQPSLAPADGAAPPQEAPAADPGPRSEYESDGTGFAEADPPAEADAVVTPYGLQDDVLDPPPVTSLGGSAAAVPSGMTIARPAGSMPDDVVADVYQQQVLASLSGKLGNAVAGKSADALLPDANGRIDNIALSPAPAEAGAGGDRTSALDLPPVSVGPLSLRLAAANGDASAEFEVAARLAEGKGTEQNYAEALRWYQRSAAKGFAQSQYRLGTFYERGLGVPQDAERAKVWYARAAEQGNVKSMHNLAVLAAGGDSGNPDYAGAMKWFVRAAEHGLADSQYNLGVLLENGLGTKVDKANAYKWYALAAKGGDTDALERRDALKATFSPDDMKAAERLVGDFKARKAAPLANDARAAGEDWKKRASKSNG